MVLEGLGEPLRGRPVGEEGTGPGGAPGGRDAQPDTGGGGAARDWSGRPRGAAGRSRGTRRRRSRARRRGWGGFGRRTTAIGRAWKAFPRPIAAIDGSVRLRRVTSASLKTIRGAATLSETPGAVYRLAQIPAPAPGTPAPAPAAPEAVQAVLDTDGAVTVTWSGSVAQTSFQVRRQLTSADGEQTPFVDLPSEGARPCVDATVPAGTRQAEYTVRALRGGKVSPWSFPSTLRFTTGAGATTQLRIAA